MVDKPVKRASDVTAIASELIVRESPESAKCSEAELDEPDPDDERAVAVLTHAKGN